MPISQPPLIEVPFAESGLKNAIPANANNVTGNAGFDLGFPPINLTAIAAGGIPPYGQDMNGILYDITKNIQFQQTGTPTVYDPAFAAAITGYPEGAKLLKADGSGWWINTLSGNTSDPDLGGANWISVPFSFFSTPITPVSIAGLHSDLRLSATGTNASVSVTASSIVLSNGSGQFIADNNVISTIDTAASGLNGLDTGTLASSTWYSVWRIGKADGTTGSLISLSATSPTLPVDYTYKARIGWIRTDSTANKYPLSFVQRGASVQYKVAAGSNVASLPTMASGVQGDITAPTWVAISVSSVTPPTAGQISVLVVNNASNAAIAAPNNAYGGYASASSPPVVANPAVASVPVVQVADFVLETANIYYASNQAAAYMACIGWEDNL